MRGLPARRFVAPLLVFLLAACGSDEPLGPGGDDPPGVTLPGTWTAAASLPVAVSDAAVAVVGGQIYVAGGLTNDSTVTAALQRYDPVGNRWSRLADLPEAVFGAAAVNHGGTLLVMGGNASTSALSTRRNVYAYDAASDSWTLHSSLPAPTAAPRAATASGITLAVRLGTFPQATDGSAILRPGAVQWDVADAAPPVLAEFLASDGVTIWAVTTGSSTSQEAVAAYSGGVWGSPTALAASDVTVGVWAMDGTLYVLGRQATVASMRARAAGSSEWTALRAPDEGFRRSGAMSAVLDGRLYLIGGREATPDGSRWSRVDVFAPV